MKELQPTRAKLLQAVLWAGIFYLFTNVIGFEITEFGHSIGIDYWGPVLFGIVGYVYTD